MSQAPANIIGEDFDWLAGLIDRANRNAEHLGDNQIRFIDSMVLNTEAWGERMFFSDKQRRFAESIERELDNAGVSRDPDDWC